MPLEIRRLDESYRGRELVFCYETDGFFDVEMEEDEKGFRFSLTRKPLGQKLQKRFTDILLAPWLEAPVLLGAFDGEEPVGFLELSHETWNNRLRVTNLWVKEEARRQGLGRMLFGEAEKQARNRKARAIVLETQSCNIPAILFYQSMGMELIGLDTCCYTNEDIEKQEVRLEFGKKTP